ncbi:MAG: hypothetical protein Q8Q29_05305 [Actinomycetota bacterium]|jgi:hypothetical protein|nr:hypothetical protein [Actinomycetota bacterium]
MDFSKLSAGAKLALVGGVILLVNMFLPWFSVDLGPLGSDSGNAFDSGFLAWGGSLIAVAGALVLLLKASGRQAVNMGEFKTEQVALILAALGTVLIVIKVITGHSILGLSLDRSIGVFLGVIAGAAVTYGAFMAMKDAGLEMPGMGGGGSGSGGGDTGM